MVRTGPILRISCIEGAEKLVYLLIHSLYLAVNLWVVA